MGSENRPNCIHLQSFSLATITNYCTGTRQQCSVRGSYTEGSFCGDPAREHLPHLQTTLGSLFDVSNGRVGRPPTLKWHLAEAGVFLPHLAPFQHPQPWGPAPSPQGPHLDWNLGVSPDTTFALTSHQPPSPTHPTPPTPSSSPLSLVFGLPPSLTLVTAVTPNWPITPPSPRNQSGLFKINAWP